MAKPMTPEMKEEMLTNIIESAYRDLQVPDRQIERFTQEVSRAVKAFEAVPPQDIDELKMLQLHYQVMKEKVTGPMFIEHIPMYAAATANYFLARIAGIENPEKYAKNLPPEQVIRALLFPDKESMD
ncbi:MAG: hypothetical protein KJ955_03145 [Nanoarchaeota archaeon]|nr:hypothetical protein [Nanoarchaeota archaeon]